MNETQCHELLEKLASFSTGPLPREEASPTEGQEQHQPQRHAGDRR